jgi:hypothetical protein
MLSVLAAGLVWQGGALLGLGGWATWGGWGLAAAGTLVLAGRMMGLCLPLVCRATVSRTLAWPRWVGLLGAGSLAGWALAESFLMRFGSLLALAGLVLAAVLAGGLVVVYADPPGGRRRGLVAGCFVLVAANSALIPWAGHGWLGGGAEAPGQAWRVRLTPSEAHGTVMTVQATAQPEEDLSQVGVALAACRAGETALALGVDRVAWPPALPGGATVDWFWPAPLVKLAAVAAPEVRLRAGSPELWLRGSRFAYELIWVGPADRAALVARPTFCFRLMSRLTPTGVLIVEWAPQPARGEAEGLVRLLAGACGNRGGLLAAGGEQRLLLAFSPGGWEAFQRRLVASAGQADGSITFRGIRGRFTQFADLDEENAGGPAKIADDHPSAASD